MHKTSKPVAIIPNSSSVPNISNPKQLAVVVPTPPDTPPSPTVESLLLAKPQHSLSKSANSYLQSQATQAQLLPPAPSSVIIPIAPFAAPVPQKSPTSITASTIQNFSMKGNMGVLYEVDNVEEEDSIEQETEGEKRSIVKYPIFTMIIAMFIIAGYLMIPMKYSGKEYYHISCICCLFVAGNSFDFEKILYS